MCSNDNFEIRSYVAAKWSATSLDDEGSLTSATSTGFERLFKYIEGANSQSVKIPMTAPVLTRVSPAPQHPSAFDFVEHFYMPDQTPSLSSLPQPTDPSVSLVQLQPMRVAVAEYGGYTTDSKYAEQLDHLHAALAAKGFHAGNVSDSAGYDSPWKILGRHNEVWVPVSTSVTC